MTGLRRTAILAAAAALLVATAACGSESEPAAAPPGEAASVADSLPAADPEHNAADVDFLQLMIDHHQQGLALTGLADERTLREEVQLLAAAIDTTQRDEVTIMTSWLESWDQPTTLDHDSHPDHGHHAHHGGLPATGPEEIEALRTASDADFEQMFLVLLTGHQNSAVELAGIAADGVNPQTQDLAQRIEQSRADQVAHLLRLVGG